MDKLRQLWNVSYPDKRSPTQALITPSASPPTSRTPSRQRTLPPDQPSPAKKPRFSLTPSSSLSSSSTSHTNDRSNLDFEQARRDSALRLRDSWSTLAERYSRRLDEDDIIDLRSIKLYKDRGIMRGSSGETRFGFMSVPDEPEPSNDASSEGGGAHTEGEDDDDEIDAFGVDGALEGTLEEKLRRAMPPRGRDPFDEEDLKEFMEAEKRRQEEFGNVDEDSGDEVDLRNLVDQEELRTDDRSEREVEDEVLDGDGDGEGEEKESGGEEATVFDLDSGSDSDSDSDSDPGMPLAQVKDRGKATAQKKKNSSRPVRSGAATGQDSEDELGVWEHDASTAIYRLPKTPAPEKPRAKSRLLPDVEVIEILDTPSPSPSPILHPGSPVSPPPPISPMRFSPSLLPDPSKLPPPLFSQIQLQTPPQSSSSTSDYTPTPAPIPGIGPSSCLSIDAPRPRPKPRPVHKNSKSAVDVFTPSVASSSSSRLLNGQTRAAELPKKKIMSRTSGVPEVLITTKPPGKKPAREGNKAAQAHIDTALPDAPIHKDKDKRRPATRSSPSPAPLPRPIPPRSPWLLDRKGKGRAYVDDEIVETSDLDELACVEPPPSSSPLASKKRAATTKKATASSPSKSKKHTFSKKPTVDDSSSPPAAKAAPTRKRKRVSSPPDVSPEPPQTGLSRISVRSKTKSSPPIVRSKSPISSSDERDRHGRYRSRSRVREGRSQPQGRASPDEKSDPDDRHSRPPDPFYPPPNHRPDGYGRPHASGHPGPPYPPLDGAQAQYILAQAMQQISYLIGSVGIPHTPSNGEHPPWPPPGAPPGQYHAPYPPHWPPYPPPHAYHERSSSPLIGSASSSRRPSSLKTPTHRPNPRLYTPSSSSATLPPSSPDPDAWSSPIPSARSRSRARSKSLGRRVSFKLDEQPRVADLSETDGEEFNGQNRPSSPSIERGRSRSVQRESVRKGNIYAREQKRGRITEPTNERGRSKGSRR